MHRAPIDVHASVGCLRAEPLIEHSATQLLDKAQTRRPYAGLIVRQAVVKPELTAMQRRNSEALEYPSFLNPLERVSQAWWQRQSYRDPSLSLSPLKFIKEITGRHTTPHSDQALVLDADKNELPEAGPITALVILRGSVTYSLAVLRKDVFDHRDDHNFRKPTDKIMPANHYTVTARTGDLVVFTNIPPVIHEADAFSKRLTIAYLAGFERVNPVE
jgi:hypothetical protein